MLSFGRSRLKCILSISIFIFKEMMARFIVQLPIGTGIPQILFAVYNVLNDSHLIYSKLIEITTSEFLS
jgi:hypothetical protein